ncbi:MAG: twin-arginine translocase TatA/TatE family subunit [Pseudomonadota bacterium]|nr:twin-arginine translocase TatA/TatE family subunit [Sphingomonas sp.]MDQ3477788.1 twin-arginine translocase TatA/TatE family subunit [Pseudomonadota bacterium]
MGGFSLWHILIFAIILLLLFGGNRFSTMMKDVAKGLKGFKEGLSEDEKTEQQQQHQQQHLPPQSRPPERPIEVTPEPRQSPDSTVQRPVRDDEPRS